jgi:hypothetical protein
MKRFALDAILGFLKDQSNDLTDLLAIGLYENFIGDVMIILELSD